MSNTDNNNRFKLFRLDGLRYAVFDNQTHFTVTFKKGDYNGSQKVIPPDTMPDDPEEAVKLGAYAMRSIGEYIAQNHIDIAFTTPEDQEKRQHFYDVLQHAGQAVADLRKYNGQSVEEAAESAGITVKKLQAIERGRFAADLNYMCRIVEKLGGRVAIVPEISPNEPHCQFIEFE